MSDDVQKVAFSAEAPQSSLAPTSFEVAASDDDEAEAAGGAGAATTATNSAAQEQKTKKLTGLFDLLDTDDNGTNNQSKTNNNATPVLGSTASNCLTIRCQHYGITTVTQ